MDIRPPVGNRDTRKDFDRNADRARVMAEEALAEIDEALSWGDITQEQAEEIQYQLTDEAIATRGLLNVAEAVGSITGRKLA